MLLGGDGEVVEGVEGVLLGDGGGDGRGMEEGERWGGGGCGEGQGCPESATFCDSPPSSWPTTSGVVTSGILVNGCDRRPGCCENFQWHRRWATPT